ncbi:uncharacterized protein, partial [Cherax quadricarinatus]
MGGWFRSAFRVYTSWERRRRVAALPPTFLQAALSSGWRPLRTRPPLCGRLLIGITLVVVVLLPWAARTEKQGAHLAGVGMISALTASVVCLCGCLAKMADQHHVGISGEAAGGSSSSSSS